MKEFTEPTNLRFFRLFYQAYASHSPEIHHELHDELAHWNVTTVLDDYVDLVFYNCLLKCFMLMAMQQRRASLPDSADS